MPASPSSQTWGENASGENPPPGTNDRAAERPDMIVLVGSNTAWCHPILFQRILKAKEARPDMWLVVIDPRRTETAEIADVHLQVKPGSE